MRLVFGGVQFAQPVFVLAWPTMGVIRHFKLTFTFSAQLFQVFGQEFCDIFESGDIFRIDIHQGLVRFEAGAGDFLL